MKVIKRDKTLQEFDKNKIEVAIRKALDATNQDTYHLSEMVDQITEIVEGDYCQDDKVDIEDIQNVVEDTLMSYSYFDTAKAYILYRAGRQQIRDFADKKINFINKYKESNNTANATVDDNANVAGKNIGILNAESHKDENIQVSRAMIMNKLRELYPDFDAKNYVKDLEHHIIYKHDESSFCGAISPYCCSISMYPFLTNGLKEIGGLSASPKNLDSFCGMYINLIFAISGQFAGAVATSEFITYFDHFARKEWGNNYYQRPDENITCGGSIRQMTIRKQIHQYFQQVIYSINQPAAARGMQAASKIFCIS